MKKQVLDYQIDVRDLEYNINTPVQEKKIVEALNYIESRGVEIVWEKYKYKERNYIFRDKKPEIPEKLVLYIGNTLGVLINRIDNCLEEINLYDEYQQKCKDNEDILRIKSIIQEKHIKSETNSEFVENTKVEQLKTDKVGFKIVTEEKAEYEYPLDGPTEKVLGVLKGYNQKDVKSILRRVNSNLPKSFICQ